MHPCPSLCSTILVWYCPARVWWVVHTVMASLFSILLTLFVCCWVVEAFPQLWSLGKNARFIAMEILPVHISIILLQGSSLHVKDSQHSPDSRGTCTVAWLCHHFHPIMCTFLETISLLDIVLPCFNVHDVCGGFCGRRPVPQSLRRFCYNAM